MQLSRQQQEQFHRDGFLVFPGLFSKAEIAASKSSTFCRDTPARNCFSASALASARAAPGVSHKQANKAEAHA